MRVTTWNVNSLRVRLEQVVTWSEQALPDVLCLQETKVTDDKFPAAALKAAGFVHQAIWGQKTYNGVAILSRFPLTDVKIGFQASEEDPQARLIRATIEGVRIYCCYVPNGSKPGSIKFRYKLAWLRKLRKELDAEGSAEQQILVCGDFNIAPADEDVWDPFEAVDEILFHPLEHKTLKQVTSYGLTDALRVVHPTGQHFSWWDFRGGGFQRNRGYRIDHHWVSDSVAKRIVAVETHREVRGWERPSDHVPVVAVLD